jgi:hypothetical protein
VSSFGPSRDRFEEMVGWLDSAEAEALTHDELEAQLQVRGRGLTLRLFQDHLELRAVREVRMESVTDAGGILYSSVEADHSRGLQTLFGDVTVRRLAYRHRGCANLHPADAGLNLPADSYSYGLRRLSAIESTRGSFEDAVDAVQRSTGQRLGKRQVEGLVLSAATDFEDFYATRPRLPADPTDVLILSCDGKGIVMRPEALRPATAEAAARAKPKLATRLSRGEKRNRKRMAEVGSVYEVTPAPRTPADILVRREDAEREIAPGPTAKNKWVAASVVEDAACVVGRVFDQAEHRDPEHSRTWVALVDGNRHQIDRIQAEATDRGVEVTIVVDLVHVLEYLWKAAWCFFDEGDPAAEEWVYERGLRILDGHAAQVAGGIRARATREGLSRVNRENADLCADYLMSKRSFLNYSTALARGWPISTGVIEGACRHLVKDRMDITGARWGLPGAEAVLRLRALIANGDFDDYWAFHRSREHARLHRSRYAEAIIPMAA